MMNGNSNFITLITSEDVDFLNLLPLFLQCGVDDDGPTNSSLLHKVPEVTLLKARAGNWKINLSTNNIYLSTSRAAVAEAPVCFSHIASCL